MFFSTGCLMAPFFLAPYPVFLSGNTYLDHIRPLKREIPIPYRWQKRESGSRTFLEENIYG
ncbi:hypothetical protein ALP99_102821 [Pseudomonas syringae pv. tomato]|uniref:Uncharacterized protein n=5 Tax=Pseudomonas syringae group TaxID=136849 RepID=A0A0Q0C7J3_PSESX|nr:hypothetical protein PSPTOT1_0422 [Pseudomonas syringae pv. tomato T1]KPW40217.1 hypothetical protein ALO87_102732 [Pseudomonas syringae pv. apii]KPW45358.1 hypothetical protein ALO86_102422 [Pseudomonas syringae pv. berberidis]KPW51145.1 hypothetical protein ALO88_102966 [Pseudomonas syringae pv. antirrhini]KPX68508.1 hypothetical protein ALO84_102470 [Pseudomonas syringae pv. maculicola]KPY17949.1 hypothetical protein ALO54_102689 [Pseudomonas syringae pv. philadelphi]KPY93777.1 hypothet